MPHKSQKLIIFLYFPIDSSTVATPTKFPEEKIMDILEFRCMPSWQKDMILQNFDVTTTSIADFVEFCEPLEMAQCFDKVSERVDQKDS